MGKRTELAAENMTLTTGTLAIAAFQTAAAGSLASIVAVTRIEISQSGSTTLAMIRGAFGKRDTAGTLTMTATSPGPKAIGGAASGLAGNTAPAGGAGRSGTNASVDSGGTYTDLHPFAFANLNGYLWKPDPDEEVLVPASTLFVVRFLAAPATLTGWTIAIDLEELS
jgi:hypothetical protein